MEWPCTWEEAEAALPGVSAEWDALVLRPDLFDGPGPGTHGPVDEVTLSLRQFRGKISLQVTQADPSGKWCTPPSWVRGETGIWSSPMPLPKALLKRELLVYNNMRDDRWKVG